MFKETHFFIIAKCIYRLLQQQIITLSSSKKLIIVVPIFYFPCNGGTESIQSFKRISNQYYRFPRCFQFPSMSPNPLLIILPFTIIWLRVILILERDCWEINVTMDTYIVTASYKIWVDLT